MSGLSETGFERKRLVDIKTDIENRLKLVFGENIDLTPQSGFGQFVGIESEAQTDQWQNMENVYNSQYPSTAQGAQLSNVVLLNGIERQEATNSTVTETLTGIAGTVILTGSKIATSDTASVFVTLADATIGVGGTIDVAMEAEETGEIEAAIGTLTEIKTPVYGLTSATNAAAASIGREEETDAALRIRREQSTQALGQNLVDSLYGQLLNIDGVTDALVQSNGTDAVVDGIPAHQFLSVVLGGLDADIASAIWANTPQGIGSFGATTVIHTDAQGFPQDVLFSRPSEIDIYFKITIGTDSEYPVDGTAQLKQAVVDYGDANFSISDDVILTQFYTPINSISGIVSIDLRIGLVPSPTGTSNLTIDLDEVSAYDITDVEVIIV